MISSASDVHTEAEAYRLLEALRWPDGHPACPHCGSDRRPYFLRPTNGHSRKTRDGSLSQRRVWKCAECRKQFSVLTGTVLHGSKLPVRIWLLVIDDIVGSETGASAREIERNRCLRPETSSSVVDRLREALKREPLASLVSRPIEVPDIRADVPRSADQAARLRAEIQSTIARVRGADQARR